MEEIQRNESLTFPEITLQPVMWGSQKDLHDANRYRAIVASDTGKLFAIVSKGYKIIRHEEAIEQVERAIDDVPELGNHETITEFHNDGGRIRRTYRFPDRSVKIMGGDQVIPEIHLFNSYDLTWPFTVI